MRPPLASFSRDDRQEALFVSDTMHFGDRWQTLLGVRYTDYEVVDRDHNPAVDVSYQTDAYSPTYALIFKPTQQVSLYGSFVEAMEKGVRVGSTSNVRIGMGVTYLDAAIEQVSPQNQAIEGNVPAGVQDWQAVASIDYRVPQVAGLSLFGNVRYYDDAYYETGNRIVIPARTLANVGLQYRTEVAGRRTVVTGTINNLFDDLHWEMNSFGENRNAALGVQVYW